MAWEYQIPRSRLPHLLHEPYADLSRLLPPLEKRPKPLSLLLPPTSTQAISVNSLIYGGRVLKNARYRPKTVKKGCKHHRPSWVWEHGAELQADGYDRLWVCKLCYTWKTHCQIVVRGYSKMKSLMICMTLRTMLAKRV